MTPQTQLSRPPARESGCGDDGFWETPRPDRGSRLSDFGDRDQLGADLTRALEPGSPARVVAVFALLGWNVYCRLAGNPAGDALIARHAERFARIVESAGGVCYRPRPDEFCALLRGPLDAAEPTLLAAEDGLNDHESALALIGACYGAACLPDEAADPTELLILADERLRVRVNREPRERRRTRPSVLAPA